jgi:hypothetical protein
MSDSQVLRNEARKGVVNLVGKMGGSSALQNTAGNLADKALVAGAGALMKNKGKILGKLRKLTGWQKGGVIVIKAQGPKKKSSGRRKGRKSKK